MNTIINNLTALVSEGAFSQRQTVEPMSAFKWNILFKLAEIEDVAPYIYKGIMQHEDDAKTNIPKEQKDLFAKATFNNADNINTVFNISDIDSQHLSYPLKRFLLKDIVYKERHSIDTSKISLDLLSVILQNTNIIFRNGIRLRGIVELGVFLRTKGQYVDYVKLEAWLQKLKFKKMASLQASILVSVFAFEESEFPYIKKFDKKARQLTEESLFRVYRINKLERQFSKYNIRNSIKFRGYSRSESLCKATSTIIRSLSEIEE